MESIIIYKQMWKTILIQNYLQNIIPDMGERSSELRDGLKEMRRIEHKAVILPILGFN